MLLLAAALLQGCAAHSAEVELILSAVPPVLKPGETGQIEVRMVTSQALASARLSARSSAPGLTVEPESLEIGPLPPVKAPSQQSAPPNPPALGVVPIRHFTLKASQTGRYQVTVRLEASDASATSHIEIGVNP